MSETMHIKIEPTGNEVHFRTGQLPAIIQPQAQTLRNIYLPDLFNYLLCRSKMEYPDLLEKLQQDFYPSFDQNKALLISNSEHGTLELHEQFKHPHGTIVHGSVKASDEYGLFTSSGKKSREEMVKLLRFKRPLFAEPNAWEHCLQKFQAVVATFSGHVAAGSDTRGASKNASSTKEVLLDIPTDILVIIPLLKNGKRVRARVDICYDVTDGSMKFWLESAELEILYQEEVSTLVEDTLVKIQSRFPLLAVLKEN